jgi:hypothetical protein
MFKEYSKQCEAAGCCRQSPINPNLKELNLEIKVDFFYSCHQRIGLKPHQIS